MYIYIYIHEPTNPTPNPQHSNAGFHLYEYARHFVTCVRRILGVTYDHEGGQVR